jgi:hypothetical protein
MFLLVVFALFNLSNDLLAINFAFLNLVEAVLESSWVNDLNMHVRILDCLTLISINFDITD